MQKFIVAICALFVTTNALADHARRPKLIDDNFLKETWQAVGNWTIDVTSGGPGKKFMSADRIGERHQSGACGINDEGAGVAIIATEIFRNGHGARFCARQIQSANEYNESWIDFYHIKNYKCFTFCLDGWYGNACDTQNPTPIDEKRYNEEFDNIFDTNATLVTNDDYCHDTDKIDTESIPAFYHLINHDNNFSQITLLGVLDVKVHGILVGTIDIKAKKTSRSSSWIESAMGNGNTIMLCASGYEPDSANTDCVRKEYSPGNEPPAQTSCGPNEIFSNVANQCVPATAISKYQMRLGPIGEHKCWMIMDAAKYRDCINGVAPYDK